MRANTEKKLYPELFERKGEKIVEVATGGIPQQVLTSEFVKAIEEEPIKPEKRVEYSKMSIDHLVQEMSQRSATPTINDSIIDLKN